MTVESELEEALENCRRYGPGWGHYTGAEIVVLRRSDYDALWTASKRPVPPPADPLIGTFEIRDNDCCGCSSSYIIEKVK